MSEKSIPSRSTEAGANILQGRGGQAIIQDVVGNILLTTQNKTGSDQQVLSVNDSISSIALLSGETPTSIDTKIEFPSDNFNTINWEQTPIGRVQVIQPVYDVTSSVSLDIAKDIIPTSSVSQSVNQQEEQQLTSIEEQLLFLPDNETQTFQTLTDLGIAETGLKLISFIGTDYKVLLSPESTKAGSGKNLSGGYSTYNDNNPMNVINTKDNWNGKIGSKKALNSGIWFVVFDNLENGIRAGLINLSGKFTKYKLNTVEKIIDIYAPGGSPGQPKEQTELYIKDVTKYLQDNINKNIKRNTILKFNGRNETDANNIKMFKTLAKAIIKEEGKLKPEYFTIIDNFDIKNLN
jgi:hypothetical protein